MSEIDWDGLNQKKERAIKAIEEAGQAVRDLFPDVDNMTKAFARVFMPLVGAVINDFEPMLDALAETENFVYQQKRAERLRQLHILRGLRK